MSYLAPTQVGSSFAYDLCSTMSDDECLIKFWDNLFETYIDDDGDFPVDTWAESRFSMSRTTNSCEQFFS